MPISKKVKKVLSCPTCAATYALLRASRVPSRAASKISRSKGVKAVDKGIKRKIVGTARKKVQKQQASALREANKKARKKNGQFRAGWDQARLMRYAHKLRKRKK
jgi:hypothetical protein